MKGLSFDGGGIRGLLTAYMLRYLERALGRALRHHVDCVAGSSIGAVIAAAVARGIPAADMVTFMLNGGPRIFPAAPQRAWSRLRRTFRQGLSAPLYDPAPLAALLDETFGGIAFGELGLRTLVLAYDTDRREELYFDSHEPAHRGLKLTDVLMCSTAAEGYFPPHPILLGGSTVRSGVDGGNVFNNPAPVLVAEVMGQDPKNLLLSFGTGKQTRSYPYATTKGWGFLNWMRGGRLINVFFDARSHGSSRLAEKMLPLGRFRRHQVDLLIASDDMNDASLKNLAALGAEHRQWIRERGGAEALNESATLLLEA